MALLRSEEGFSSHKNQNSIPIKSLSYRKTAAETKKGKSS